jgi:hypothetical protein
MEMAYRLLVLEIRFVKKKVLCCLFEAFEGIFERVLDALTAEGAIGRIMSGRGVIYGALRLIGFMLCLWHVALVIIEEPIHRGCARVIPR